jgi:hypothetical protein
MTPVAGRRWRRGAAALALVGAGAGTAALVTQPASGKTDRTGSVKPLDRNVWIVQGRIDPDRQRFCARGIASIVPNGELIYVICDSRGRVR